MKKPFTLLLAFLLLICLAACGNEVDLPGSEESNSVDLPQQSSEVEAISQDEGRSTSDTQSRQEERSGGSDEEDANKEDRIPPKKAQVWDDSTLSGTAGLFLESFKSWKLETAARYALGLEGGFIPPEEEWDEIDVMGFAVVRKMFSYVEFEILSERIMGDEGIVDVSITAISAEKLVEGLVNEAALYSAFKAKEGEKADADVFVMEYLRKRLSAGDLEMTTMRVTLHLVLDESDNRWKVDLEKNSSLLNTMLGGMEEVMDDVYRELRGVMA